jgi:Mn2+/Fe2+ NRAMP family transporter
MKKNSFSKLGPGILFAAAAIGVSHLVQSTKAGALYGLGLIWAVFLIQLAKYPFFEFGTRYTAATKENLIQAYFDTGKWPLYFYVLINLVNMFSIQAAVTVVTSGILGALLGFDTQPEFLNILVLLICLGILWKDAYKSLNRVVRFIVLILALSTLGALGMAIFEFDFTFNLNQIMPSEILGITFLISFLGWLPAPLDISIWQSLWEEKKESRHGSVRESLQDFNIGYLTTLVLGLVFLGLGAILLNGKSIEIQASALGFAKQLFDLYTSTLGQWSFYIIGITAFTTMFSTTITTLDASPRVMSKSMKQFGLNGRLSQYKTWLILLVIGTQIILYFFNDQMVLLISIATILSFLTAPFFAFMNWYLVNSKRMPKHAKPSKALNLLSLFGLIILIGFTCFYVYFIWI